jgi:hypothetical protein
VSWYRTGREASVLTVIPHTGSRAGRGGGGGGRPPPPPPPAGGGGGGVCPPHGGWWRLDDLRGDFCEPNGQM